MVNNQLFRALAFKVNNYSEMLKTTRLSGLPDKHSVFKLQFQLGELSE